MSNSIKIHRPTNRRDQWDADENTPRSKIYEALIPQSFKMDHVRIGEEVAEFVFHVLNAPEEMLSEVELKIANDFRAPGNYSLSTGDVVEVDGVGFLCESFGWKEVTI
jgi:carotenoid cleavage dioxygenase-like enzyme